MKYLFSFLLFVCVSFSVKAQLMQKPSPSEIQKAPAWAQEMYADNANVFRVDKLYKAYYRAHDFEKSYHTQYYKKWRRTLRHHMDAKGDVNNDFHTEKSNTNKASVVAGNWSLVGPIINSSTDGNVSSRQSNVYCIDQSSSHENILYCGTETGECYKSINGGESWFNVSLQEVFGYSGAGVKALDIHPSNPNIVYVCGANAVFKTTNGGSSWEQVLYVPIGLDASEILIHATNPNIVLVTGASGLYRTTDGGENWAHIYEDHCYDIKQHTSNSNVFFLLKENYDLEICEFLRSEDGGLSFTVQSAGWYASTDPGRFVLGGRIAVTKADPNRVYAYLIGEAKTGDNGYIGLYKSTNGGVSWTLPNGPTGGPYTASHMNLAGVHSDGSGYHQGFYNCALLASDDDPDELLVGGILLYHSADGGASFEKLGGSGDGPYDNVINNERFHADMQDFRQIGNTTWITTDGGIYRSEDFFATTNFSRKMQGIHSTEYWGFGSGWNEDVLVGGTYHNGVMAFHENYDDGNFLVLAGGEPASGYVNPGENKRVYSTSMGGRMLPQSIGDPVSSVNFGIHPNESYWAVSSSELEFDPSCYSIAYTGKDHQLWKTTNKGASFTVMASFGSNLDNKITYIEPSWSNADVMYVCQQLVSPVTEGKLWRTTNGGDSWEAIAIPQMGNSKHMLCQLDPEDHQKLWIAFGGNGNDARVFSSVDGGANWTDLTTPTLNGESIRSIALIGGSNDGLYLATQHGIFYRNATMSDWVDFSDGMPMQLNTCIAKPFYRDQKMRIASYGKGIWESPLYENQVHPVAKIMVDQLEQTNHCEPAVFHYVDHSMLAHQNASWDWTFEGGVPATGDQWNEEVSYENPGTYLSILKVTDGNGNTDIDSLYVTVAGYQGADELSEDFETVFPAPAFEIVNYDGAVGWQQTSAVGGYGLSDQSMYIEGYYATSGEIDDAIIRMDMSYLEDAMLKFDVAYSYWGGGYTDTLEVLVTTDCGENFESLYYKGGEDLETAPDAGTAVFVPLANEWRTDSIDFSSYEGLNDVMIYFRLHQEQGQHCYLDNIHMDAVNTIAVEEMTSPAEALAVYPNHIREGQAIWLHTTLNEPIFVEVFSLEGKRVYRKEHAANTEISLMDLCSGTYVYVLSSSQHIKKGKLVIQ